MNIKAVIDTNVLVSAFLTKNPDSPTYRVAAAILDDKFTPVYSLGVLNEYADVLGRDYLKLPSSRVDELLTHKVVRQRSRAHRFWRDIPRSR